MTLARPLGLVSLILALIFAAIPQLLLARVTQGERKVVVVVLDLQPQNVSPEEAALMTDYLRDELVNSGDYQVVERQRMNEIIAEQDFQRFGVTQEEYAVRLGQLLNASKIFLGTSGMIQDVRVLAVRIVDVETGRVETSKRASGFGTRDTDEAMKRIVLALRGLPAGSLTADWPTGPSKAVRYLMVYGGWNAGNVVDFQAESMFKSGPVSGIPIWTGGTPEIKSRASFPGFGLRLGAWNGWFGGDLEISVLSHHTVAQSIPYDLIGHGYFSECECFIPVNLESVTFPDKFIRLYSLGFGGNIYINIPFQLVQPYVGMGASLLMNKATSDYPGPGSYTVGAEGEKLNSTSLGWAVQLPIGIKLPVSNTTFLYLEFRPARHYFSIISGTGFVREKDRFTLQTFQIMFGTGFLLQ